MRLEQAIAEPKLVGTMISSLTGPISSDSKLREVKALVMSN